MRWVKRKNALLQGAVLLVVENSPEFETKPAVEKAALVLPVIERLRLEANKNERRSKLKITPFLLEHVQQYFEARVKQIKFNWTYDNLVSLQRAENEARKIRADYDTLSPEQQSILIQPQFDMQNAPNHTALLLHLKQRMHGPPEEKNNNYNNR